MSAWMFYIKSPPLKLFTTLYIFLSLLYGWRSCKEYLDRGRRGPNLHNHLTHGPHFKWLSEAGTSAHKLSQRSKSGPSLSLSLSLSALNLELQIECNYLPSLSPSLPLQFVFTLYDLHWATVQQFDKRRHRLSRQETGADLGLEWGPGATTMSASVRVWLLCAPLNFAFNWFVNTNVCRVGFLALSRLARPTPAAAAATSGLSFGPTTRGLNTRVMQHKFATLAGKLKVASGATQRKSWCGATSKTALTTPSETIINHSAPTDLSRTVADQDGHYIWKGSVFNQWQVASSLRCLLSPVWPWARIMSSWTTQSRLIHLPLALSLLCGRRCLLQILHCTEATCTVVRKLNWERFSKIFLNNRYIENNLFYVQF